MKTNEKFLEAFISLESLCADKLGITTAGVSEYISRLSGAKMAIGRDETVKQLTRFRKVRNRLVHENGALRSLGEISQNDIKWLKKFEKSVKKSKDPLSRYYKQSKGDKRKKRFLACLAALLFAASVAAIYLAINWM
jgi:predicted transcriptional regulator